MYVNGQKKVRYDFGVVLLFFGNNADKIIFA